MENKVRMPMTRISRIIWEWLRENFENAKQVSYSEDRFVGWSIQINDHQGNVVLEKLPHGYILYTYPKNLPDDRINLLKITEPFKAEAIGNPAEHVIALVDRLNFEYRRCAVYGLNLTDPYEVQLIKASRDIKEGELNMNIKKIMFNTVKGVTTVIFDDGTHVMAKCSGIYGEKFDPEIGLAICIAKKYYGSRNKFEKAATAAWEESYVYNRKRGRKMMKKKAEAEGNEEES